MGTRISSFGCLPVVLGIFVSSVLIYIYLDDPYMYKLGGFIRGVVSLLASGVFILPVYAVCVFIAGRRILLHLTLALFIYVLFWTVSLVEEGSRTFAVFIEQLTMRIGGYWLLYCLFFMVMFICHVAMSKPEDKQTEQGVAPDG